jgi:hypothetical protein
MSDIKDDISDRTRERLEFARTLRAEELERLQAVTDPFPKRITRRSWTDEEADALLNELFSRLEAGQSLQLVCEDEHMPEYATIMTWLARDGKMAERYEALKPARARALFELALWESQRARDPEGMKVAQMRSNVYLKAAALLNPGQFSDKTHSAQARSGLTNQPVNITLNIGGSTPEQARELTVLPQLESGDLP